MRIPLFLGSAVLLASFLSPALAAQQFQAPNVEELRMTADPKAPGAGAASPNISKIDEDPLPGGNCNAHVRVLTATAAQAD